VTAADPVGRRQAPPRDVRLAAGLVALTVLAALPGFEMARVYSPEQAPLLGAGAAAAAVGIAGVVSVLARARLFVSATASVVGFALYAGLAAARSTTNGGLPTSGTVHSVGTGLVHGWARLLSTSLPANPEPVLLIPVVVLAWVAGFGGAELAIRRRWPLTPAGPALAATATATVLAAGRVPDVGLVGGVFVAGLGVLLGARAGGDSEVGPPAEATESVPPRPVRPPTRLARLVGGTQPAVVVAVVAVLALVGAALGAPLTFGRDRHPYTPRRAQPADTVAAISPLDLIKARLDSPNQAMFTVRAASGTNWQLAVLDDFDGYDWSTAGAFAPTGDALAAPPPPNGSATVDLHQTFTLQGLTGPWLPAAASPVRISGVDFDVDLSSGTLVRIGPAALRTYQVTSQVSTPSSAALVAAELPPASQTTVDTALPAGLPPAIAAAARTATAGASTPFTEALLLERYLRSSAFRNNPKADAGHSYGHLVAFLTKSKEGTSEQFASAFAVMGRVLGLPTRLAVGFGEGSDAGTPGVWRVRSGDAQAWPEVDFAGLGWVSFDPTPPASGAGGGGELPVGGGGTTGAPSFVIAKNTPQTRRAVPVSPPTDPASVPPHAPGPVRAGAATGVALIVAGAIAALVVILAVSGTLVVLAKTRRRRRRRLAGDPRQQVSGAWSEVLDRLRERGWWDDPSLTVAEIVAEAGAHGGHRSLVALYRPVNQALFDDRPVPDTDAQRAWRAYDTWVGVVARRTSRRRRVVAALDPRPLLGSPTGPPRRRRRNSLGSEPPVGRRARGSTTLTEPSHPDRPKAAVGTGRIEDVERGS
jgi:transglutaminase-like putative cysteine protease